MIPHLSSPARRRWTALAAALLVLAALALLDRRLPGWQAQRLPTGAAEWIWETRDHNNASPTAFYVARDFDLGQPPARARLAAVADEEYVLYLNGRRVGAGSAGPAFRLDVYEVGGLLRPGGNRLVAELRSGRGAGGFLASLNDGATGRQIVATDGTWRVVQTFHIGLIRGWMPLRGAEPAFSWGFPPLGRWGRPEPGPAKPLFAGLAGRPVPASPGAAQPRRVLFDFGREVTGHLVLEITGPPAEGLGKGLLFTGDAPPAPVPGSPGAAVLVPPGQRRWLDTRPRRFRYALVLGLKSGLDRPLAARVLPVDPARVPVPVPAERKGVFGIADPPPLRAPVEDEVWSELQRLPGVARREEP